MKPNRSRAGMLVVVAALTITAGLLAGCEDHGPTIAKFDPALVDAGRDVFRYDTFGDEKYWTDTLRMHEVIQAGVSPATALAVGLKVDVDALPEAVKQAILAGQVDLNDPAVTVALLKMNAVVGVQGQVENINGRDSLVRFGVTCALCHSTVDNSFLPGIGKRLDGWANTTLQPGTIVALSPAVDAATKAILRSWGAGKYDPRINIDGKNTPIVVPPAYGLRGVALETFTGDGPVSYWNAYVAVTQMHGQGNFSDPRLGIRVEQSPDLVTPKLAALRNYQLSITSPRPAPESFDASAAARGRLVFASQGKCSTCHTGALLTDVNSGRLHQPGETGMDGAYAARTATRAYRTTPLRGLFQHAPYFHDGSAATLADVVDHYDRKLELRLSPEQRHDLIEYLKSL